MTVTEIAQWLGVAVLIPIVVGMWAFIAASIYVMYQEAKK